MEKSNGNGLQELFSGIVGREGKVDVRSWRVKSYRLIAELLVPMRIGNHAT